MAVRETYWTLDSMGPVFAFVKGGHSKPMRWLRFLRYPENLSNYGLLNILAGGEAAASLAAGNRINGRLQFDFGRTYSRTALNAACVSTEVWADLLPVPALMNMEELPAPVVVVEQRIEREIKHSLDSAAQRTSLSIKPGKSCPILHVMNVGQGDSILVESINGENWLIDAYFSKQKYDLFRRKIRSLKRPRIDRLIISHFHYDHIKSAARIIADFSPVEVIVSDTLIHPTAPAANLLGAAARAGILSKVSAPLRRRVRLGIGGGIAPVAHFSGSQSFDPNDHTMAICLETNQEIALLAGDAPGDLLNSFWAWYGSSAHKERFYKVTHHCSSTGSDLVFLNSLRPAISVTSCSRNNRYRHPADPPRTHLDNHSRHIITYLHGADVRHPMT